MAQLETLGIGIPGLPESDVSLPAMLKTRRVLHSILNFTGYTIHDIINDPIARNTVIYYYRVNRELQKDWMPTAYHRKKYGKVAL